MFLLRAIYVLLQLVTIASPGGRNSFRHARFEKKERSARDNKRPCKLFEMNQKRNKFACAMRCTSLMGCYNYERFPQSGLCILCVNEESIILEKTEFSGLVPYNSTIPAGGTFKEKNDQDDCFLGLPCYNGGTCVDAFHSFTCSCIGGFTGARCESADALPTVPIQVTAKPAKPANFWLTNSHKTWTETDNECKTKGGRLASFNNETEQSNMESQQKLHSNIPYWIGLNDISTNEQWMWVDGAQLLYTKWWPDYPKNTGYNCVAVYEYRWYNAICTANYYGICKGYN